MSANEPQEQSLYQRLGGYDGIAAATDDLLARLQADPRIKDYWKGSSLEVRRRGRQLVVDFMVEAAGGPAYYVGRDMKKAHEGMQISAADWAIFMEHAEAMLDHFNIPTRERGEVLGFLASMQDDVVEVR